LENGESRSPCHKNITYSNVYVKFKFKGKSLHTKNDSERRLSVSLYYYKYILWYIYIAIKVIYFTILVPIINTVNLINFCEHIAFENIIVFIS